MTTFIRMTSILGTIIGVALLIVWLFAAHVNDSFLWMGAAVLFVSMLLWLGVKRA